MAGKSEEEDEVIMRCRTRPLLTRSISQVLRKHIRCDLEYDSQSTMPKLPPSTEGIVLPSDAQDGQINYLLQGDDVPSALHFVEDRWFQSLVACVICANAVLIGLETDLKSPNWWWAEQALLAFFLFEIAARILHTRMKFLHPSARIGNLVDVAIVLVGVFDLWVIPVSELIVVLDATDPRHQNAIFSTVVGMLRLLRIVRLVRFVKIVQPLYRLVLGVIEAVQSMFWVLVFLFMMIYVAGILCTRFCKLHSGVVIEEDGTLSFDTDLNEEIVEILMMFRTVCSSMFILFEEISCWSLMPFAPLFNKAPVFKLFGVMFYAFSTWCLLAVLTGVVSEKMISLHEKVADEAAHGEKRFVLTRQTLKNLFLKADTDGSGSISEEELNAILICGDVLDPLTQNTPLKKEDFTDMHFFTFLDSDHDGHISFEEFAEGFKVMTSTVTPKCFVKLQEKLAVDIHLIERSAIAFIESRFRQLFTSVKPVLQKIQLITEQIQFFQDECRALAEAIDEAPESTMLSYERLVQMELLVDTELDRLSTAQDSLERMVAAGEARLPRPSRSSLRFGGP
eukprot:NODE_1855_length_2352_cov_19.112809.p1 GENE.NODE_1855_length_2352_cov_19.112809~~NODE_1855_length_2352_cov_19.112809.p1  ORF type:complete len:565 (-),score=179.35 NODE_1855_length_2352_cov_19.112809:541-2235(-)